MFSRSMLSDHFPEFGRKGFVGSIGLSPFEISARSGGKLAENGMRGNADTRLGEILKGEQAGGAGRQAGRGLCPVEEQTTTPTHPKISSPEWLKPNTQRHAYRPTPLYFHFQSLSLSTLLSLPPIPFLRFDPPPPPPPPKPVSRPRHPSSRVREIPVEIFTATGFNFAPTSGKREGESGHLYYIRGEQQPRGDTYNYTVVKLQGSARFRDAPV